MWLAGNKLHGLSATHWPAPKDRRWGTLSVAGGEQIHGLSATHWPAPGDRRWGTLSVAGREQATRLVSLLLETGGGEHSVWLVGNKLHVLSATHWPAPKDSLTIV